MAPTSIGNTTMNELVPLAEHLQGVAATIASAIVEDESKAPGDGAKPKGFDARVQSFIDNVVAGRSGAEAARLAGYGAANPKRQAFRLLSRDDVRDEVNRRSRAGTITADLVLSMVSDLARLNIAEHAAHLYEFDAQEGRRRVDWNEVNRRGLGLFVREVGSCGKAGHEVLRFYSRMEALALLAKAHGLTRERVDLNIVDVRKATDEELARLANS